MPQRCERPGCNADASVAYGMRNDALLVWLDAVPEGAAMPRAGMLCRRHADAMVVPRGWTLDDRREANPRLFNVASVQVRNDLAAAAKPPRRKPTAGDQLRLGVDGAVPGDGTELDDDPTAPITVADLRPQPPVDPDETQAMPWRFTYDAADDLGGVLAASSPLLARAFRGEHRAPRRGAPDG